MDTIDSVMSAVEQAWRRQGVGAADRAALATDLRLDLAAAAADGVGPDTLIGPDVTGFARRLADEAGVERLDPAYGRVIGTALLGAGLGAAAGFALMTAFYPVFVHLFDIPRSMGVPVQAVFTIYYGAPGVMVAAGVVLMVRHRLRHLPRIRETVRAMALLVPLAGIVVTPVTVGFSWLTGYSTTPAVILLEVLLPLGAIAGATATARQWSLREGRRITPARPPATADVKPA